MTDNGSTDTTIRSRAARLATAALPYAWPVRIGLGVMFLMSAWPKLQNLSGFAAVVGDYGMLPGFLVEPFGYAVPFVELTLGVLLLLGFQTRLASLAGAALMIVFIIALVFNLVRGNTPECGCFEIGAAAGSRIDWNLVARDLVFLAGLAIVYFDTARHFSLDRWIGGSPNRDRA